jgi:hypothetical protein
LPHIIHPAGEVVISMRPVSVFANRPGSEIEQLEADLHGRWRQAARAVMVLLSAHGLPHQMLATAAPWTSPWLPPGYEQNFWNAA